MFAVAATLLSLLPGAPPRPDSAVLLVRVLDVSDARIGGDAILITDSAGGRARHILIDASDHGRTVVAWLQRFGVDTLALLVLSHPHADHYGGMAEVLRRVPVGAFASAGTPRTAVTYRALLADIDRLGITPVVVDTGVRRVVLTTADDSLVLTLLAPPPGCRELSGAAAGDDVNNCSLGVRLARESFTMLFPGDAERAELDWWTARRGALLLADVLKAGHHGSINAMSPAWLDAVRPRAVVISANGRQHPFAEVLDLLASRRIPAYCTADAGTITIRVPRGGSWTVTPERPGACHPRTVIGTQ
jgi:competence protein ComEC